MTLMPEGYKWLEGRHKELTKSQKSKLDSLKAKSQRVKELEAENALAYVGECSEKSQTIKDLCFRLDHVEVVVP